MATREDVVIDKCNPDLDIHSREELAQYILESVHRARKEPHSSGLHTWAKSERPKIEHSARELKLDPEEVRAMMHKAWSS